MSKSKFWESLVLCSVMCLSNSAQRGERNLGYLDSFARKKKLLVFWYQKKKYITDIKASSLRRPSMWILLWATLAFQDTSVFTAFYCLSLQAPGKPEILSTTWKQLRWIFTSLWQSSFPVRFSCILDAVRIEFQNTCWPQGVGRGFPGRGFCRAGQPLAYTDSLQG